MKIKFIRADISVSQGIDFDEVTMVERDGRYYMRPGVEIEVEKRVAWIHVGNADAVPADDEAQKLCASRMANWAYKLKAREALARGIHPDDMDDFMTGRITGYTPDGEVVPGPNWEEDEQEDDE